MLKKIFKNRKSFVKPGNYWTVWAEFLALVLLLIGLVIGVASPSAVITYLIAIVAGMAAGRFVYERKEKGKAPYILIIIGFVMGYVIGTFHGNRIITLLFFLAGAFLSYYLFNKGIVKDTIY